MKKFLLLLLSCFIAHSCFAQDLQSNYQMKFRGINPRVNPRLLQEDESPDCSNISLQESGSIQDRSLFGQYNSSSGVLGSYPITGLFKFYTSTGKFFIATAGAVVASGSAGAFSTNISSTESTVSGSFWTGVGFNNKFYLFNPSIPMQYWAGTGTLTTITSGLSVPSTNCAYGASHKARLWAARSDSFPYRLYFSSLTNGQDWTTTGGFIDLPDLTATITGIVSYGGVLYVFTEVNIYALGGSTPNDFALRKTNSTVGAVAPRSIKTSDIGIIFLARTGVFAFDGNNSTKLSDKIEPLMNNISTTLIQNACAIYDGQNRYWLAYSNSGSSYNDKVIIFDTILKEWYPYDNLNINYFERAYGGTDRGELYGGSSISNGIVWLLQKTSGTESISSASEASFNNATTFNTVSIATPGVKIVHGNDWWTKLLVHFDGANGATTYRSEDSSIRLGTFNTTAQLSTTQKKFGPTSVKLTAATSDYVSFPDSNDWFLGQENFCIDFWVNFSTAPAGGTYFVDQGSSGVSFYGVYWTANNLVFECSNPGLLVQVTAPWVSPTVGVWHHVAVDRSSTGTNGTQIFIDGTLIAGVLTGGAWTYTIPDLASTMNIGARADPNFGVNGYMDEVRITRGRSRYSASFTPESYRYEKPSFTGELIYPITQINASASSSFGAISWNEVSPANTKVTFQTRTGVTADSVYFNGWSPWSSASTVTFDTVTNGTVAYTSTGGTDFQVIKPPANQLRNVLNYEDEDDTSPNCVGFVVSGPKSFNCEATESIASKDMSGYKWLTGWVKSPATGNSVRIGFGERAASENTVTFNVVNPNTWEKYFWYIGDIPAANRNTVTLFTVRYIGVTSGTVFLSANNLVNYYTTGDNISSPVRDFLQYKAVLGSNDIYYNPLLTSVNLIYTPTSGTSESSRTTYYFTKYLDLGTPQVNKAFVDLAVEYYISSATYSTAKLYCDYSLDDGTRSGTFSISPTSTGTTVRKLLHFPSSTYGKNIRLKFYNTNKDVDFTVRAREIRFRQEQIQND